MDPASHAGDLAAPPAGPVAAAAFEGSQEIAEARAVARTYLADLHQVHGLAVPGRVAATVQLVVSELVTNAGKYAPGPCLLTLGMVDGCVEVSVWDSSTTFPTVMPPDPARIGQHGLEIVMSVCSRFTVQSEPVGKRITAAVTLTGEPGAS